MPRMKRRGSSGPKLPVPLLPLDPLDEEPDEELLPDDELLDDEELPDDELLPLPLDDPPLDEEPPPPELLDELPPPNSPLKKFPMLCAVLDTASETVLAMEVVTETTVSVARCIAGRAWVTMVWDTDPSVLPMAWTGFNEDAV